MSSWCAENHDSGTGTSIRCHTYVMNGGVCIRTNTVPFYMEANRQVGTAWMLLEKLFTSAAIKEDGLKLGMGVGMETQWTYN